MGRKYIKLENLFVPGIALILFVILGGLFKSLAISFGYFPEIGLNSFTTEFYTALLKDKTFLDSLAFTLHFAFLSSLICIVIGLLMAYGIYFFMERFEAVLNIPVIIPHMIVVVILLNFLSQSGFVSRLVYHLGWISDMNEFPGIFYNKNAVGIILVYVLKGSPFAAIVFLQALKKISKEQFSAARNLGAGRIDEFRYIYLPRVRSSVYKVFLILFTFSFGSYETPNLIGPTSPRALGVKSYIEFTQNDFGYKPFAFAINVVMAFVGLVTVILFFYLESKDDENFI